MEEKNYNLIDIDDDEYFDELYKAMHEEGPPESLILSAEQGDPESQCELGLDYMFGYDTAPNFEESLKWLNLAAAQGNEDALKMLEQVEKAKKLLLDAEGGDLEAQYQIGRYYYHGYGLAVDIEKAKDWYVRAAERGHTEAMYELGFHYDLSGTEPRDGYRESMLEARKWYTLAAKQGHAEAAYRLGRIYYYGFGFDRFEDHRGEAIKCFEFAAEKGLDEAQYTLAVCYYWGYGTEKNVEKSLKWFRMAAEQGNKDAIDRLRELGQPVDCYTVKEKRLSSY